MPADRIVVCTRGSALALAQANAVVAAARAAFPKIEFRVEVLKTTGDKLQTAALAQRGTAGEMLPRGLFTKELEQALLESAADVAVHSLKDLPTDLPPGLLLGATPQREDVREVLIYRGPNAAASKAAPDTEWRPGSKSRWFGLPGTTLQTLPKNPILATSSTRRAAQIMAARPDAEIVPIRGNVGTRLQKIAGDSSRDGTMLAAAGLRRLGLFVGPKSRLTLEPRLDPGHGFAAPPEGLLATILDEAEMLPAVGQGAVGLEIRSDASSLVQEVCAELNHRNTFAAITAERCFLRAMGGGCQSPVAAFARVVGHQLWLRAVSYQADSARSGEAKLPLDQAEQLGQQMAQTLR